MKKKACTLRLIRALAAILAMASTNAAAWSVYHDSAESSVTERVGPDPNDVTMRTLEFREVPAGSEMDVFQAMRDFHANRLEWTYIDFDERNREAVERVKEMGRLFGGAGSASLHGSIYNFPAQPKEIHMLDLDGNMIVQPHMRGWADNRGIGDPSNPDYFEHHLAYWKKVIDWGAEALHRDEPESPVFAAQRYGGGFSPTGIAGFREWLSANLSPAEREELGIELVENFDYAEYLREKDAPTGDDFRTYDDPLKPYWIDYWSETTVDFWNRMIREIKEYADDPNLTISCNNSSLQMWAPYHLEFDFSISELLLETANPVHLWERSQLAREVGKLQVFGPPKTRSRPVALETKNALLRRVFATAYACGMLGKVPWDVYDQSPDGQSRYFAEPEVIADLSAFVRAQDWAGYREAVAFGPGIPSSGSDTPEVHGGSGGVYGFLRAQSGGDGAVLLHLVDWGLPVEEHGSGSWFTTPTGERIKMYEPAENLRRTEPEPFTLVLPEEAFDHPGDLVFELLTQSPYDPAVHVLAEETGDFQALVRNRGVPVSRKDGLIILEVPALEPWGILRIRPGSSLSGPEEAARRDSFGLLDEDRWVVLGDSITQSGRYHRYVENFLRTRFPESGLLIFNEGIGGDIAAGALRRLDWDVFSSEPTVVSVMFGMNDVGRSLYFTRDPVGSNLEAREERLENYRKNLRSVVTGIEGRGARVILVTPSPADDTMNSEPMVAYEVNEGLARCAAFVRDLAAGKDLPLVRFFEPMRALNLALQEEDPTATLVGRDRVHPGVEGHFLMAYLWLLEEFGEVPVSTIVIDAEKGRTIAQAGGKVSSLQNVEEDLSFDWKAESLPFPIPDGATALPERLGFRELFNREILSVRGLSPGSYQLSIDGLSVLTATATEWSAGVDLTGAAEATPQMRQAREVVSILERKQDLQQSLSDIAFCEMRLWGDRPRPVDREKMRILLREVEENELKRESPRSYLLRRYREYESLKETEEERRKDAIQLMEEAREKARPAIRKFVMKKVIQEVGQGAVNLPGEQAELWLCAGQSNMAFPTSRSAEAAAIVAGVEGLGVFTWEQEEWVAVTPANAGNYSAVAVSFASAMARHRQAPTGFVVAAKGGTAIEAWVPVEDFPNTEEGRRLRELVDDPDVLEAAAADEADFRPWGQHRLARWDLGRAVPATLFEQHVRPLAGLPVSGVVWYQGESNTNTPAQAEAYRAWLRNLIGAYRALWNSPEMPFIIVQLPRFEWGKPEMEAAWSILRETQREVAESMENVGWVDIFDLGDPADIHPVRKQEVGERAAVVALSLDDS